MRIGHIELFVNDTQRSKTFYAETLGFEIVALQGEYVWVKCGDTEILLRPGGPKPHPVTSVAYGFTAPSGPGQAIVLYTHELDAVVENLREKGLLLLAGADGPADCLAFTDPDGHWWQLVDPASHPIAV